MVISEIMSGVERTRIDTERNLLAILEELLDLIERKGGEVAAALAELRRLRADARA